jgi:hypothetical protein
MIDNSDDTKVIRRATRAKDCIEIVEPHRVDFQLHSSSIAALAFRLSAPL